MPPRSYRKRKIVRRRRRRGTNWGSLAMKAYKTAKFVAGLVNAEDKYVETSSLITTYNYNGTVGTLIAPAQGTGATQRTGDSIKIKDLTIRGSVKRGATDEVFRLIIFWDKDNSIAGANQFLDATYLATANAVYSPKDPGFRYNTKTLWDKSWSLTSDKPFIHFSKVIKINDHTAFNPGTTTIRHGALKALWITQTNVGGAQMEYITRITYLDN